jgi:hypothetical protein
MKYDASSIQILALLPTPFLLKSGELVVIKGDRVSIQRLLSLCEMGEKRIVGFAMAGTKGP